MKFIRGLLLVTLLTPFWNVSASSIDLRNEVIYHVMPRSFYDSNGDRHGDLNGLVEKLDYLQQLGVTTILLTPLYESGFYHNYFPTNYEKIDPEYGTMQDYLNFVEAIHQKGMKVFMDMETQYAQSGHRWFDDSYQNPNSAYSDFIYYSDDNNEFPEQIFIESRSPLHHFDAWPGLKHHIVFLDLNHPTVKGWMESFYAYWVDPNQDGDFSDGVDGFRIDHIMDDLDYKGLFTNMYRDFWKPIFKHCKSINSNLFILGEQSNWNEYGEKMVHESGANAAFSFPLRFALAGVEGVHDMYGEEERAGIKIDANRIHETVKGTIARLSGDTFSVNFLENHDTERWASVVHSDPALLRLTAILNLLLPGVPSIYYGQELGLTGLPKTEWNSDANHLPVREAFPWTADSEESGTAVFYKDTGPWWDESIYLTEAIEQLNLATQEADDHSLWHFYRSLLQLRREHNAFRLGNYTPLDFGNDEVVAFMREYQGQQITVIVNFSDAAVKIESIEGQIPLFGDMNEDGAVPSRGFVLLEQ